MTNYEHASCMTALVADGGGDLTAITVDRPMLAENQVLVAVHASSANFGEMADVVPVAPEGYIPGWDAVGTVVSIGRTGSRFRVGDLVATVREGGGGWAEYRAAEEKLTFRLPPGSSPVSMAVVPVAGGTAVRAVRLLGSVLGVRVMVTGASSTVGCFVIQLLVMGGAEVVAVDAKPQRHPRHRDLGASETLTRPHEVTAPVAAVVETVGGDELVQAFRQLEAYGRLIAVGHSARDQETFPIGDFEGNQGRHGRTIETFYLLQDIPHRPLGADVEWLARRVNDGSVRVPDIALLDCDSFVSRVTSEFRTGQARAVLDVAHGWNLPSRMPTVAGGAAEGT